jgi:hypothetical protein
LDDEEALRLKPVAEPEPLNLGRPNPESCSSNYQLPVTASNGLPNYQITQLPVTAAKLLITAAQQPATAALRLDETDQIDQIDFLPD